MVVVVQLVLALGAHPLLALFLVPLLRRTHRHRVRRGGMDRREGEDPLQARALAVRARRLVAASDQRLELASTVLAGVLVDRYDSLRIVGGTTAVSQ